MHPAPRRHRSANSAGYRTRSHLQDRTATGSGVERRQSVPARPDRRPRPCAARRRRGGPRSRPTIEAGRDSTPRGSEVGARRWRWTSTCAPPLGGATDEHHDERLASLAGRGGCPLGERVARIISTTRVRHEDGGVRARLPRRTFRLPRYLGRGHAGRGGDHRCGGTGRRVHSRDRPRDRGPTERPPVPLDRARTARNVQANVPRARKKGSARRHRRPRVRDGARSPASRRDS